MRKPNIFNIATKELSQDAFIAWLLMWADPENAAHSEELNKCGSAFASELIKTTYHDFDEPITNIQVERQWNRVDVMAEVNNRYCIVIEDKTNTAQHSGQLERYREIAEEWCDEYQYLPPVCIYLKTGNEHQSGLNSVENDGYRIFLRRDFLELLRKYQPESDIYNDFRERLEMLEKANNEWGTKPIKDWIDTDWQGFFQFLEQELPHLGWQWSKIYNPAGGFWGAFTDPDVLIAYFGDRYPANLQIEHHLLSFKIDTNPAHAVMAEGDTRQAVRDEYCAHLLDTAQELGLTAVRRPERLGSGKNMTIAVVDCENWLGDKNSPVNREFVKENILKYINLLNTAINES
jgi:hypothetical protein